ncbi:Protein DOWNY MILDEW RESISTANCE 6 [Bienertia sinuspersici]
MANKILSTGVPYKNLPEKYVRPQNQRPNLSQVSEFEDVPVIDIGNEDRVQIIHEVTNHGVSKEIVGEMQRVAQEFFKLPVEEKMKLYSDDPTKTMRLSTSFNVNKEEVHNWRDYLRLHCWPLEDYLSEWPSNPPSFK